MKVVLWAPVEETVPPKKYGGTELVVANLAKGLVKKGHDVHVLCSGDSKPAGHKVAIAKEAIRKIYPSPDDARLRDAMKIISTGEAIKAIQKIQPDIIHNNLNWRGVPFVESLGIPAVSTIHGPITDPVNRAVFKHYPNHPFVSISNAQRKAFAARYVATVYNGIEVDKFHFARKPGKYLAFLGRMSPEKGPFEAIKAAKAAKIPLVMAAKVDAVDKEYFEYTIKPEIDGKLIKFIGEVDHEGKVKLLSGALALLALIQWEEPFGLFMAEAMACGTPVIASRRGSVPELVMPGKTGLIVKDTDHKAHVKAIKEVSSISRQVCRDWASEQFSVDKMTEGYLKVYEKLIK